MVARRVPGGRGVKPALALALLLLQHPPAMPTAEPIVPLDTRLETLPVAWYGSRWPPRSAALIERMARMTVVILMQQDGACWTRCCPQAGVKPPPSIGPRTAMCGPWHDASAEPGCDPGCDQHGTQLEVFGRIKAAARSVGARPPHCMLYTNAVYLWPFDRSSELGAAVQVTDARGDVHVETADPGLFPSYLWAFDRPAAREAWVDVVRRGVVNGSADGVYVDCYMSMPLFCHAPGPPTDGAAAEPPSPTACFATNNRCKCAVVRNSTMGDSRCDASRCDPISDNATTPGKPSLNENVTAETVAAYHAGKPEALKAAADAVAKVGGSFFSKQAPSDRRPPYGGSMNWIWFQALGNRTVFFRDRGCAHAGCALQTPDVLIRQVTTVLRNYRYVMVGEDADTQSAEHNPSFESRCGETAIAMFLLAVEPGAVLLCQGWDEAFAQPLGLPTAPAAMDAGTGTWSRSFARGATATVFADGHGSVSWGRE